MYALWQAGGYFAPEARAIQEAQWPPALCREMPADPFVVTIPPPNVTGVLHMGHGLNISIQDICIRYKRMCGYKTVWIPGCDHAGIATQHVVERVLRQRGQSREALGRRAFVAVARDISNDHHDKITTQIQRMGASCDWTREAFTLDDARSRAVREVFVALYQKGLLYRGKYLVNWCARCHTALSDDEVEHRELMGALYRVRYPLCTDMSDGAHAATNNATRNSAEHKIDGAHARTGVGNDGAEHKTDGAHARTGVGNDGTEHNAISAIEIVTTRPETMLGDEAIAVHPDDPRWQPYIGARVQLPLTDKTIPIIADTYIDREFGSGALKVTPAHDPNDFEIAERHALPVVSIFTDRGTLNKNVPAPFQGLTIAEARRAVVEALERNGYLVHQEQYAHQVGHCYRCGHIIEPFLSTQWFVKMKPLAVQALESWKRGEITLTPSRWEATYRHWLENIRDWCISRQLWWGHRIPVWYDAQNGEMIVSRDDPTQDPRYRNRTLVQDEDVLDTWFSSWLWPFSTLGWPEKSADMAHYYPTSVLITGYDIIFFWVARMIMAGKEFTGQAPFRDVILTGLIRDKKGKKMSKSAGNGINPLDIVDSHGADALKFSLIYMMAHGQDIRLAPQDFAIGSRFANKIWNAARFILSYSEDHSLVARAELSYTALDRWIYARLQATIKATRAQMDQYRFSEAVHTIYDFFWNDFCDWYLEITKYYLREGQNTGTSSADANTPHANTAAHANTARANTKHDTNTPHANTPHDANTAAHTNTAHANTAAHTNTAHAAKTARTDTAAHTNTPHDANTVHTDTTAHANTKHNANTAAHATTTHNANTAARSNTKHDANTAAHTNTAHSAAQKGEVHSSVRTTQKHDLDMVYSHLLYILEIQLRLLHPFMSFITEELYQHILPLRKQSGEQYTEALIIAPYPQLDSTLCFTETAEQIACLQEAIGAVRTIRSEFSIPPTVECRASIVVYDVDLYECVHAHASLFAYLTKSVINTVRTHQNVAPGVAMALPQCEVVVHIMDNIDRAAQLQKIKKEYAQSTKRLTGIEARLVPHSAFCTNAKDEIIAQERSRLQEVRTKCATLARFMRDLA